MKTSPSSFSRELAAKLCYMAVFSLFGDLSEFNDPEKIRVGKMLRNASQYLWETRNL